MPTIGRHCFCSRRSGWLMDRRMLSFILLFSQSEYILLTHLAIAWQPWCVVHQCTPQGYKQIVLFVSFQQRLWASVTVKLHRGWWCLDILHIEDRYCYSIALTFCFQTDHLFWLCPGEIFMCMNFSAITLALLFMSINSKKKKRKKMPSLQLLYQKTLSVSSRLFC